MEELWKSFYTQGDTGGKINSFGNESTGHCEKNIYMNVGTIQNDDRYRTV
jgi:hypothetical protein